MASQQEKNDVLDEIIINRRSIRRFKPDGMPKEMVEQVIKAGFAAPFARATEFPLQQMRKFVVIKKESAAHGVVKKMIMANAGKNLKKLKMASFFSPKLKKKAKLLVERLTRVSEKGLPSVEAAPYFIVIAERKGIPASQKQSMAHAMENMWLKATALGLGLQLVTATGMLSGNKEFMATIGLNDGEYEIDACVIGYPDETPAKRDEIDIKEYTKWLE
jgi:nitroreductase